MPAPDFDKTIRIPVVTEVVRAGDADIIERSRNPSLQQQRQANFEQRLKERIAELQAATGHDTHNGLARSHAIRAESSKQDGSQSQDDPAIEKQLDQARAELLRELSGMLK